MPVLPRAIVALLLLLGGWPALSATEHPFILWTPAEADAIRQRLATDPDAKAQLAKMEAWSATQENWVVWNLFRYQVLGDEEAGATEKEALLRFIGRRPDPVTWDIDLDTLKWNEGMPSSGDSHMRDEQTLNTLRYDVLYHLLSDEERAGVEAALRSYIDFHLAGHKPWHPDFKYDRTSWLPNMHWPRAIGTHLMAAALGDEDLIRQMHESQGGWRWFFDEYIADGQFYMEEFGKYYSNIGTMLMYCEALEELGLSQYGYGYTGAGGATMRRYLEMSMAIGLPRLTPPAGATPAYPRVTMGDAGDLHYIIEGIGWEKQKGRKKDKTYITEAEPYWRGSRMNGPLPKMREPGWFEVGHARWPEAGFDYFLAQMRPPGADRYLPSLYWNLSPIAADAVSPPPAPSYASRERGFALLRAEEGPAYWEGPAPAVSLQFGMYYVHYVHDCFSILQYVAHNRLIYNRTGRPEGRKGYAGGDDWKDHVRGHSGVVVDGLKAKPVDRGNAGTPNHRIRDQLAGPGRFVAVRAAEIYPDVDQERALLLTDAYLLDCFRLVSDHERTYDWQVLAQGSSTQRAAGEGTPVADWQGRDAVRPHLQDTLVRQADDQTWSSTVLLPDRGDSTGVGVTLWMLGQPDTLVLDALPPGCDPGSATSLLVSRRAPTTSFVALHAPFAGGSAQCPVSGIRRIAEDEHGCAVQVTGAGFDDHILIAWGDAIDEPRQYQDGEASYSFTGFALIRIGADRIEVQGDLASLRLPVSGEPALVVNGEEVEVTVSDGLLRWR